MSSSEHFEKTDAPPLPEPYEFPVSDVQSRNRTFFVAGATGRTGRLVVDQLLERGHGVIAMVRSGSSSVESRKPCEGLEIVEGNILESRPVDLAAHLAGCDGVAICLGHPLSWRGVFGPPRRLVRDAVALLAEAANRREGNRPPRLVLMGSAGVRNPACDAPLSRSERLVLTLLRTLLPPHADNEEAAATLRSGQAGRELDGEWCVIRPDTLFDEEVASCYDVDFAPQRSALFDPGRTSRINVAHFMAELLTCDGAWNKWRGEMPVIYNRS